MGPEIATACKFSATFFFFRSHPAFRDVEALFLPRISTCTWRYWYGTYCKSCYLARTRQFTPVVFLNKSTIFADVPFGLENTVDATFIFFGAASFSQSETAWQIPGVKTMFLAVLCYLKLLYQ